MSETPWKTDQWFVSPWNYAPEVQAGMHFAPRIQIHDVTLRDGEQQAGVELRKDEKVRIAERLAEMGVHRIEAGMPAVSPEDEAAIKEIVRRRLGPKIFAFSRCMVDDVKRAVDCGVDGVIVEIPSSQHIIQYAYQWPLERAIDLSVEVTRFAHEQGLHVTFFPIDGTRAEVDWYLNLIERVARDGHMDALALVDTMGACSPEAIRYFVRRVRQRIHAPLEAHFHNDMGLAVANTLVALQEGVEVAHTTVAGLGERAGNCPMEDLVVALRVLYGQDLGLRLDRLYDVAQMVARLAGHRLPTNKAVVGEMLYKIESGIVASWTTRCLNGQLDTEILPLHWTLMGQPPAEVVLGKGSGRDSIAIWLQRVGETATSEQIDTLVALVKQRSLENKGLVSETEFRELVRQVKTAGVA